MGTRGAHGRTRTGTLRILSALSLRWTTWAKVVLALQEEPFF